LILEKVSWKGSMISNLAYNEEGTFPRLHLGEIPILDIISPIYTYFKGEMVIPARVRQRMETSLKQTKLDKET
jgi:hypothetical protein